MTMLAIADKFKSEEKEEETVEGRGKGKREAAFVVLASLPKTKKTTEGEFEKKRVGDEEGRSISFFQGSCCFYGCQSGRPYRADPPRRPDF